MLPVTKTEPWFQRQWESWFGTSGMKDHLPGWSPPILRIVPPGLPANPSSHKVNVALKILLKLTRQDWRNFDRGGACDG
jgi:hypothetical protein